MSPPRAHRRSRRRSWFARIARPAAVIVVIAVLIGGITQIARQSGPYDASTNRSFAAAGAVVAEESTATGSSVRHLMGTMQGLDRQTLQVDLDDVVAQTVQQESQAAQLSGADLGGGPPGSVRRRPLRARASRQRRACRRRRPARSAPPGRDRSRLHGPRRVRRPRLAVVHRDGGPDCGCGPPADPGGSQRTPRCAVRWSVCPATPGCRRPGGSPRPPRGRSGPWPRRSTSWPRRALWRPSPTSSF